MSGISDVDGCLPYIPSAALTVVAARYVLTRTAFSSRPSVKVGLLLKQRIEILSGSHLMALYEHMTEKRSNPQILSDNRFNIQWKNVYN